MALISLDVTHESLPENRWAELKFNSNLSVGELKERLQRHVGTTPSDMVLTLVVENVNAEGKSKTEKFPLSGDSLGASIACLSTTTRVVVGIHVEDTGQFSSVKSLAAAAASSDVSERYRMSDDDYAKRDDSARKFLKDLHKNNPDVFKTPYENDGNAECNDDMDLETAEEKFPVGHRCQVSPGDRRGQIAFVGKIPIAGRSELRIGVRLDEPQGDSDGTHPSKKTVLVECDGDLYCTFAKHHAVDVGDYPPVDPFDLDEL
eukprot:CAMPEP_0113845138 /NCGR_PEP_ID=MMETSP0372-20130328/596_1 /TAXON_ID=340204 /ORGANISM="Lankesteria abbotti" /LENGTH=260 /DNA_ID=CAMNT_0000814159 /DNA_START=144 /DNA_END=926 /DNA_ORIENTATION=- /assembly_acc=CAM_ASM_000359